MESAFMQYIVNRFLCHRQRDICRDLSRHRGTMTDEHRNLKNLSNRSNHESDNSIEKQESTNA